MLEGDELDELLGYPKKEHHAEGDKEKNAAAEDGEASKEENGGGSSSESGDEVVRELPDIEQVDEKTLNAPMDENNKKTARAAPRRAARFLCAAHNLTVCA